MNRLLTVGARRPRLALTAWVLVTAILGVMGMGVGKHLTVSNLLIPGTQSAREAKVFDQQFGGSLEAPILLSGPAAALDREGPALVHGLERMRGAHVVSAWDGGSLGASLHPSARSALVLVAVTHGAGPKANATENTISSIVKRTVAPPVRARVSGLVAVGAQLEAASLAAVHRAELIAIPILLVVLLLVFGSPGAAAIPAVLGFGTVLSGFGLISLLTSILPLTELATVAASMMGLALGVDYSLLVVSRFRDELGDRSDPREIRRAATVAALRAGRTVAFAGGAISILMMCALAVAAGTLLLSAVVGVIVVAAVSVASTVLAAPAALALFGTRIAGGRRRAPHPTPAGATAVAGTRTWVTRAGRTPVLVALVLAILLAVGWQSLSLTTGAPDARQLPANNSARRAYEAVSRSVGPGWLTPFELLVVVHGGAITTLPRLDALAQAQNAIAHDPDVADVVGPGPLARQARPIAHAAATVAGTNRSLARSAHDVGTLSASLGRAVTGAGRVQSGFAQAASALHAMASGGAGGTAAVAELQKGLEQAAAGSRLTDGGMVQAAQAAGRIMTGGRAAVAGATRLASELGLGGAAAAGAGPSLRSLGQTLHSDAAHISSIADSVNTLAAGPATATAQLATATQDLAAMRIGRSDPRYAEVASALEAAQSALAGTPSAGALSDQLAQVSKVDEQASEQADSLAASVAELTQSAARLQLGAQRLDTGLATLERGQSALANGIKRLAASGAALTSGLTSLSTGTATLGARLGALQSGANHLAGGLQRDRQQVGALTSALSSGQRSASATAAASPRTSSLLGTASRSPGVFKSGYLVLATLEGTAAAQRAGVDFTINVAHNGQAARMLIMPRSALGSAATGALRRRLESVARKLAAATGAQVLIGGPAAQLRDYASAAAGRMPLLIAVLMAATFILLVVVFRSLYVALVGVLLNLLSVGAAFGTLALLTCGRHPLIGGPGYVDALSVSAIFAAIFALSIDYQVFLLTRIREGWVRTGSVGEGVDYGIARTARIVAGAAAVMVGVFLVFATADVATVRQLGVGLAAAIAIDATVVRLILLPFALRLGGRFTWWMPAWLEKRLPAFDSGAERRRTERPLEPGRPVLLPAPAPELEPRRQRPAAGERPRSRSASGSRARTVAAVRELAPSAGAANVGTAAMMPLSSQIQGEL